MSEIYNPTMKTILESKTSDLSLQTGSAQRLLENKLKAGRQDKKQVINHKNRTQYYEQKIKDCECEIILTTKCLEYACNIDLLELTTTISQPVGRSMLDGAKRRVKASSPHFPCTSSTSCSSSSRAPLQGIL